MTEDNKNPHEAMEGSGPQVQTRLVIELLTNGAVKVEWPQSPVHAFGMLEEAKRVITRHFDAAAQPMIQGVNGAPARPGLLGGIRRNLG